MSNRATTLISSGFGAGEAASQVASRFEQAWDLSLQTLDATGGQAYVDRLDEKTRTHSVNTGRIMVRSAVALDMPIEEASMLGVTGVLHDLGKMHAEVRWHIGGGHFTADIRDRVRHLHTSHGAELVSRLLTDEQQPGLSKLQIASLMLARHGAAIHHTDIDPEQNPGSWWLNSLLRPADVAEALTNNNRSHYRAVRQKAEGGLSVEEGVDDRTGRVAKEIVRTLGRSISAVRGIRSIDFARYAIAEQNRALAA